MNKQVKVLLATLLISVATHAPAYLGGFEEADGYRMWNNILINPTSKTLRAHAGTVNHYNAGQYGTNAGGGGFSPIAHNTGLWVDLENSDSFGLVGPGNGRYLAIHPSTGPLQPHTGSGMLAIRSQGHGIDNDFSYAVDDFDLGGVDPFDTSHRVITWSIWVCAADQANNVGGGGEFYWTFKDSSGDVAFQLGWDSANLLQYRDGPASSWVVTGQDIDEHAYDRLDITFDMINDEWSLSYYDSSATSLNATVSNRPFGTPNLNLTRIDWHMEDGGWKTFFDDSSFDVSGPMVFVESPSKHAISNVVFYLKNDSEEIMKVKVDEFPEDGQAFDATDFLAPFFASNWTLVAYTVKAGKNRSGMGPGEGGLYVLNPNCEGDLPRGKSDLVFLFEDVNLIPLS